jgi:hypothetical protein
VAVHRLRNGLPCRAEPQDRRRVERAPRVARQQELSMADVQVDLLDV